MDFAILNDDFLPVRLFEDYSSLVWTERFSSAGDFQLASSDIGKVISALPPETYVAIRGSNVPMVVETHKIDKSLTAGPTITTTGRSFETVLDRRTTVKQVNTEAAPVAWNVAAKTARDAAYYVIKRIIVDGVASAADIIPEIELVAPEGYTAVTDPTPLTIPEGFSSYAVDPGELYAWALKQVTSEKYGIRAVLPTSPGEKVKIEIYTGEDKTTSVVFDTRFDQFDSSSYLLSRLSLKNTVQIFGANNSIEQNNGAEHTGLDRRVTYLDQQSNTSGITDQDLLTTLLQNYGTVELSKHLETVMLSGEVSHEEAARYGRDYFLGDIVRLSGDYGLSNYVRISEFIRSEDTSGEKAYPGFEDLNDASSET